MRTPAFWVSLNLTSALLWPASFLYRLGRTMRYRFVKPWRAPVPVVCIGNATAGGAGKTPTALAIGTMLKARGVNAFFLSRGYGGSATQPTLVDPAKHTAEEVGDEPLLLAGLLPTIVSADRVAGAQKAIELGAKLIVMDDGFQNPSLTKTLSFLVIDSVNGFGNGLLLPAGPLREPKASAFARTDAIVLIGKGKNTPALPPGKAVLSAQIAPMPEALGLKGKKIYAFCGIAYPQKFFALLESLGAEIIERKAYGDHAPYTPPQILSLATRAKADGALLVTTTKDAARITGRLRGMLTVVDVELVFDDGAAVQALLDTVLS